VIKGLIRNGSLQSKEDALKEALEVGHVGGIPYAILYTMFRERKIRTPTASMIAGLTWRQTVLSRILDYYVLPGQLYAQLRGTLIHEGLASLRFPSGVSVVRERRLTVPVPGHKEIKLSGQIDVYYPEQHRLEDYKTCSVIPKTARLEHVLQLAVYTWLSRWSCYPVEQVAINYISWKYALQRTTTEVKGEEIPIIEHEYLQSEEAFIEFVERGWQILQLGFQEYNVPSMRHCNLNYCNGCAVKWACDRIAVTGEVIEPEEFQQEDYY